MDTAIVVAPKFKSEVGCSAPDIQGQLSVAGYVLIRASELVLSESLKVAFNDIRNAAAYLPADRTCHGGFRYRRYGKLIALPWVDNFNPVPAVWDPAALSYVAEYSQPVSLNPEDGGRRRWFATFDRQIYANPFLRELIRFDLANSAFSAAELAEPIQVGIHLVKLVASPGRSAVSSPNLVHRDGEHYTWAHLIERTEALGGKNWITDPVWAGTKIEEIPEESIRACFTLDHPLDSYAVKDDLVAHSVDGIDVCPGADEGTRTILLIDFTPMRAILMLNAA